MANENPFSLIYLVRIIRKHLWYIVGVVGISALLAFILTMPFIYKPEFKSSVVVYPTNPERYDIAGIFDEEPRLYLYGDSKETEKLDNMANSEEVKLYVIDSLDLWTAYGVNKENDAAPKYYAFRTYAGNVSTIKVEGNGLKIEAYDIDPQRAADIVNLLVSKIDQSNREMINQNKASILKMYEIGYENLSKRLAAYTDSAARLRATYGIFNDEQQTRAMVEEIMQAQGDIAASGGSRNARSGAAARLRALTGEEGDYPINLKKFTEGYDQAIAIEEMIAFMARDLKDTHEKMENLRSMSNTAFSTILVSEAAQAADKKARPIRWIILVATVLLASLVSIIGVVLVDKVTEMMAGEEKGE